MDGHSTVSIRPARVDETEELTELCLRSKAYWGYDAGFLALCRDSLRVSRERLSRECVFVAVDASGTPVGVGSIEARGSIADLALLFVEPNRIGSGIGRGLFRHAAQAAAEMGCREMTIAADPGAAAFYESVGAVFDGLVPSDAVPGRELPSYRYAIEIDVGED